MKTLYKKDSHNKIRQWSIETNGDMLLEHSGLKDGKLVPHTKLCKGKNIGKSNATTGTQQAILEMESRYASKLDEGYFKTVKEAENNEVILPMLAKSYNDYKHKIDWNNCYIQPKLDGMRCLAKCTKDGFVTFISRDGKEIKNIDHILDDLSLNIKEDIIFDGELYAHGLNFQENMRLLKKYREGETEQIKYHIYDVISNNNYITRWNMLSSIRWNKLPSIHLVNTYKINSEDQIKKHHSVFLSDGYEGSIIRHGLKPYKIDGRSENLLKYKDFQDIACKIIDIEPAEQRPDWGVPVLEYKKKTFRAGTKLSHSEREDLLTNKKDYIGKTAEIRFFEYSDDGIPRFPVMVGIRLDK